MHRIKRRVKTYTCRQSKQAYFDFIIKAEMLQFNTLTRCDAIVPASQYFVNVVETESSTCLNVVLPVRLKDAGKNINSP